MRFKGLAWGLVLSGVLWAGIFMLLTGCVEEPKKYRSDPHYYPYYRAVEKDHTAFVFGPDQRRNGFISQDGKMIFGPERENQFIGGGE